MPRVAIPPAGPLSLATRLKWPRLYHAPVQTGPEQRWTASGPVFLYTAANWGAVAWYLEVYMRSSSAKAMARLYDVTANAAVANSTVTNDSGATGSTAYTRTRSTALTLVDGSEYQVQVGVQDGGGGAISGARLIAV